MPSRSWSPSATPRHKKEYDRKFNSFYSLCTKINLSLRPIRFFLVWKSSVHLSNYSKTLWQTLLADSLLAFEALASYIHQLSHFRLLRKSWLTAVPMIQWNAEVVYRMSRQGRNSMLCSTVGYSPWPIVLY